jgi:hypothetical protein
MKEDAMHWYHIEAVSAARVRDLQAEAERSRLARLAHRKAGRSARLLSAKRAPIGCAMLPPIDQPPDTYSEFVTRAEGWLSVEPTAEERSGGRAVA